MMLAIIHLIDAVVLLSLAYFWNTDTPMNRKFKAFFTILAALNAVVLGVELSALFPVAT